MADVFLSYASADRAVARTIAKVIESCGWSVFWNRKIDAGDNWRQTVESQLNAAGAVVVLWSAAAVASNWVVEEAERGRQRLVSVRIEDVPLPIGFGSLQGIDLIGWKGGRTEAIPSLVDAIAKTLQRPPLHKPVVPLSPGRKRLISVAAVLLAAIVAGVLLYPRVSAPPPWMNQEIVLDTSSGMKDDFDGKPSKLTAAVTALRQRLLPDGDNLALRTFGGPCRQEGESQLLVAFGTRRRPRIERASSGLEPGGQSTLVSAVIAALTDIQPLPHTRRIVVITGHADACQYTDPIREIRQRLAEQPKTTGQQPIALEMRFIGLSVPAGDAPKIQQISDTVGGRAYFVNTVADLNEVMKFVLEFEPAAAHVNNVWAIVDEVRKSINGVAQNMNQGDAGEATGILDAGQVRYEEMRPSFESLAGLQPSVKFQRFYKLAAENRALQEEAFAAGRTWIQGGALPKDKESPGYRDSVKQWNQRVANWNEVIGRCNANIGEMNRLANDIVNEARQKG